MSGDYHQDVALTFNDQLRKRIRTNGPDPLITYYDTTTGERTELSAISFANWVNKTANLLSDELDVGEEDVVALPLAQSAPGHWVTLVWHAAIWAVGATASPRSQSPQLTVVGPDQITSAETGQSDAVACSLHPLGLGFPDPLPDGVMDYALEVRGQPDDAPFVSVDDESLAWTDEDTKLSQVGVVETTTPSAGRRLIRPDDPWRTVCDALVAPVLGGGSSVIVVGDPDPEQLERIVSSERVTA